MSKQGQAVDRRTSIAGQSADAPKGPAAFNPSAPRDAGSEGGGLPQPGQFKGLYLHGRVAGRRKEPYTRKTTGELKEKVTYSIDVGEAIINVTDWDPKQHLTVESVVDLAVRINCFARKGGGAAYSLNLAGSDQYGEAF